MVNGKIDSQKGKNTCGLACLRNSFLLSYGKVISERNLRETAQAIYTAYNKKDRIGMDGIGPWGIAKLMHEDLADLTGMDFKVFMTNNGTLDQLEYFLKLGTYPIIHREFHEVRPEDQTDPLGHFEMVLKVDKKNVYLHNPAREVRTSGFHVKSRKHFDDKWWDFKGERWFLAHYPVTETLPRKEFNGKYM